MQKKLQTWGLLLALICVIAAPVVRAQGLASINGRVEDSSGAAVPSAAVTITSLETGAVRNVVADETGDYRAVSLPVGKYEIRSEMKGFKTSIQTGIDLAVGQQAVVNVRLEVGTAQQELTVTADAPLVNTTTSSIAGLVGEQQVKDLPLNGRSFDLLIALNPSTVNYTAMKNVGSVAGGNLFSVAGRRPSENLTLLNGVDYPGASQYSATPGGASGQMLGIDAVREYNVVNSDYGAEFGKRAGAQISVVTQSGSNQLHGSIFEFLRNNKLDARNFFDQSIGAPPFKRNQFGGAAGGPIRKDKMFIFGNYEGFRQRLAISAASFSPDDNARKGLLPCGGAGPACANGVPTGTPTAVPNLDPRILPFMAFWPVGNGPNLGGGVIEAFTNPLQSIHQDFGTTRSDQRLSGKDSLSEVYTIDDGVNTSPGTDPLFGTIVAVRTQILSAQETHIFSPSVINTFTAGFSRAFYHSVASALGDTPANLSFVTGKPPGAVTIGSQNAPVGSTLTSVGSANQDILFHRNLFTYTDALQIVRGKHQISAGAWFQRIRSNETDPSTSFGQATFTNLVTMLQGTVSAFKVARDGTEMGWRAWLGAWYVQDSIQLRPNLTFRVGLRHEFSTSWSEVNGLASQSVFRNGLLQTDPVVGKQFTTDNNSKWLMEPRVSVAWDPLGKGTTSIRAGFGTYHDLADELFYLVDSGQPFNAAASFSNTSLFSIIPVNTTTPFPPTCNPGVPNPCTIYSPHGIESNFKAPTNESWNFSIEQQLSRATVLRLTYLGFHGYHGPLMEDPDQIVAQICSNPAGCTAGGVNAARSTVTQGAQYIPVGARPNPYLGSGIFTINAGNSNYNALQVDLTKRLTRGLQFRGNYTWSKSMDMGTAYTNPTGANNTGGILDVTNFGRDYAPATLDVKNQISGNVSYELPFGQGKALLGNTHGAVGKLVSGWQANSIVTIYSGFPFTPLVGSNQSGNGNTSTPDRVSLNPAFTGELMPRTIRQWFNPNAFVLPAAGTFGNIGRGTLRGPGAVNWDFSLFKRTTITERLALQFRAEFFNILNHTNLGFPSQSIFSGTSFSPSAGVITSAGTSRQIQFGLKLLF